jgi:hypothetical protein
LATNAVQIIDTSYTNAGNSGNDKCPDTYVTNNFAATLLTNWWTASGCGVNSNGSGLNTSSLTPTSDGQITITLNQKWEHTLDTNTDVSSIQDTIDVVCSMVTVDSLTPDLSGVYGVQGGLEDGSDPPTYWVCPCPGDVIVTASSSPSLTADQLPDCWTFTGGVEIDKLHHKVSKTDLENGPVTFTVTCGTSTETIILEADPERDAYSALIPAGTCLCDNFTDPSPFLDRCGNSLAIDCVGCDCSIIQLYIHGHFSYRYNGIWVGTCYFPAANNTFLYKTTKHNCRILRTWHLTQQPTSPTQWVVTKYDCMTGAGSLQNCRTSPTWDFNWGRPADELIDTGYPANSCENQGTPSSGNCPPYDWQ